MKLVSKKVHQDGLDYHDLTIPSTHNYVLENGAVVHNCGCGVGFSVERQNIKRLPMLPREFEEPNGDDHVLATEGYNPEYHIVFRDSKIGWAEGFQQLIGFLYAGIVPTWDVSNIRPAGSPLRTFGGRASGPGPLVELLKHTINIFKNATGKQLNSLEVHSIVCKIGHVIVSGGVRRSALISLSNPSDDRMRDAKSGSWWEHNDHFKLANNSAAWTEKPAMEQFMEEWVALYKSHSGERGIFNREAATKQVDRIGRRHNFERLSHNDREYSWEWGTNPCFTGDTLVATADGPVPIAELVGQKPLVWSHDLEKGHTVLRQMKDIRMTRENTPVVRVIYNKKTNWAYRGGKKQDEFETITCTPDHLFLLRDGTWKAAGQLTNGDRLMPFTATTSGRGDTVIRNGFGSNRAIHSYLAEFKYGRDIQRGEVVHHINEDHCDNRLENLEIRGDSDHKSRHMLGEKNPNFAKQFPGATWSDDAILNYGKQLCDRLGRRATMNDWKENYSRDGAPSINVVGRRLGMTWNQFMGLCEANHIVVAVEDAGTADVYDGEVPGTHNFAVCDKQAYMGNKWTGFFVHNCAEIILRPGQACNLSEVVIRENDDLPKLLQKVTAATILGVLQSTFTNFRYLRPHWQQNCEEERLLGVSLTGIMDNRIMSGQYNDVMFEEFCGPHPDMYDLQDVLSLLKRQAINVAREWSSALHINMPTAITTVKPSGTVSQLVNSSSGIHPRYGKFWIRRYQENDISPVCAFMKEAGVPHEPLNKSEGRVTVFSFPVAAPKQAKTRHDVSALDQLRLWLQYKTWWAEHSVSVSVYVREEEWMEVGAWVYQNFDELTGVSFFPWDSGTYVQAPYEEISEQEYMKLAAKMPIVDWSRLSDFESEDYTEGAKEVACTSGACEL